VDRRAEIARLGLNLDAFCQRVRHGLAQATWEQKRQLIESLVARVVVADGEVEIRYVIPTTPAAEASRLCHLRSDHRESRQSAEAVRLNADGGGRGLIASDDDQDDDQASIRCGDSSEQGRSPGMAPPRRS
jgi:hypothetical protein